ncbi:MAG: hypothetical protein ACI9P5_002564 [Saprospiraceae bacterium]|jgi:hypothetical protein|tara:strand:+ start:101 stop:289 length:189 start_codon:yes stop_codon:yes gene_type:complete
MGKWIGIRKEIFHENMKIEPYALDYNLGEQVDVSNQFSEVGHDIGKIMKQEHEPVLNAKFKC